MTQQDRILGYLRLYGSITQAEAAREFGCMRLGARIYDLKQAGHRITAGKITVMNRYGQKCSVARYTLHEESQLL